MVLVLGQILTCLNPLNTYGRPFCLLLRLKEATIHASLLLAVMTYS